MFLMPRNLTDLKYVALNGGRNKNSLEPTRRAAAYSWFRGEHLAACPPAIAKQRHLLAVLNARRHRVFVEAGTYKGETTAFFARHADQVIWGGASR